MKLDLSVRQMIENYSDNMRTSDKLREVLQQTALLGLARNHFFEHAAFYGGTALRILYGLDRYSEDLDFSLLQPNPDFDFTTFLQGMNRELEAMGFQVDVAIRDKNQDTGIWSAFVKANTFIILLSIDEKRKLQGIHPDEKIQIKLEIDTDPPFSPPLESKLVKNPVPFYVSTYRLMDLFAGKMHATLCRSWQNRIKGRDWYDLIWYIQQNIPVNLNYLQHKMVQTGHYKLQNRLDEKELHSLLLKKIDSIDWGKAKKDVAPFISDPRQLELWSTPFFKDIVKQLKTCTA